MSRYLRQNALRGRPSPFVGGACEDDELPADQEAFYEHLGETDVIRFDPEIDQDEVFDDQFERRAHELQRTPGANSAISVVPSRSGPWSGNNNLGTERPFSPDLDNRQTILKLPEWGMPTDWTIALGMTHGTVDAGGFDVTAEILFGSGGVTQQVEIDWLAGSAITLPMNAVNVVARYNTQTSEAGFEIPDDLRLRVNVGRETSHRRRATRSYSFASGSGAESGELLTIPPFARDVIFTSVNLSTASFLNNNGLQFLTGNGAGVLEIVTVPLSAFFSFYEPTVPTLGGVIPFPIPPFARAVRTVTIPIGAAINLAGYLQFGIEV